MEIFYVYINILNPIGLTGTLFKIDFFIKSSAVSVRNTAKEGNCGQYVTALCPGYCKILNMGILQPLTGKETRIVKCFFRRSDMLFGTCGQNF